MCAPLQNHNRPQTVLPLQLFTMEQDQGASSDSESFSDGSGCEFEAMDLPHIAGAAADVIAAAAAAGLIGEMQCDDADRADSGVVAASNVGGAFHGQDGGMDRSGDESDSSSSSSSSGCSTSSSSSSASDAMDSSAAVAAMLQVDSDDEVAVEPVLAAAQVHRTRFFHLAIQSCMVVFAGI